MKIVIDTRRTKVARIPERDGQGQITGYKAVLHVVAHMRDHPQYGFVNVNLDWPTTKLAVAQAIKAQCDVLASYIQKTDALRDLFGNSITFDTDNIS